MSFKKNKFEIIKNVLSEDVCSLAYDYLLLKREVVKMFLKTKYINPFEKDRGVFGDAQVPNTFAVYADILMETILTKVKPTMEKVTGLKLIETYSYARLYKKGDVLKKHTDRFSCEISSTLNLGGESWPIYLKENNKKVKVDLKPGDMLVYKGEILEHWRDAFKGTNCGQVFLHYNNLKSKNADENKYDRRPMLGLPATFCKKG